MKIISKHQKGKIITFDPEVLAKIREEEETPIGERLYIGTVEEDDAGLKADQYKYSNGVTESLIKEPARVIKFVPVRYKKQPESVNATLAKLPGTPYYTMPPIKKKLNISEYDKLGERPYWNTTQSYYTYPSDPRLYYYKDSYTTRVPVAFNTPKEREKFYTTQRLGKAGERAEQLFNVSTLGLFNKIDPTQIVGDWANAAKMLAGYKSPEEVLDGYFHGNAGLGEIFTGLKKEPALLFLVNTAGMAGMPKIAKIPRNISNMYKRGIAATMSVSSAAIPPFGRLNYFDKPTWKYIFTGKYNKRIPNWGYGRSSYTGLSHEIKSFPNNMITTGLGLGELEHPNLMHNPYYNWWEETPFKSYVELHYPNRPIRVYKVKNYSALSRVPKSEIKNIEKSSWYGDGDYFGKVPSEFIQVANKYKPMYFTPVNVGGHMVLYGWLNGRPVARMSDIFKFLDKDYVPKWLSDNIIEDSRSLGYISKRHKKVIEGALKTGVKAVDKVFDPIITYTDWYYLK